MKLKKFAHPFAQEQAMLIFNNTNKKKHLKKIVLVYLLTLGAEMEKQVVKLIILKNTNNKFNLLFKQSTLLSKVNKKTIQPTFGK